MTTRLPHSPFHPGEQALQARHRRRGQMERIGSKMIRAYMPDQHRDFYRQLPFLLLAGLDVAGRPRVSILEGEPGFIHSPDARTLAIAAHAAGVVPGLQLEPGSPLGLLGIELHSRRRNRVNGKIGAAGAGGLRLRVDQSFGNCAKYIQARQWRWSGEPAGQAVAGADRARARQLVAAADTFFIASASGALPQAAAGKPGAAGVDVSHRGGRPGFVSWRDGERLLFADYQGNYFFNTLGNLLNDPRCSLLFIDFNSGDLLHISGTAEIHFDRDRVDFSSGALQMVEIRIQKLEFYAAALRLRWRFLDYSKFLPA